MQERALMMAESECSSRNSVSSPQVARKCRIPKLAHSNSLRVDKNLLYDLNSYKSDRPLSLSLPFRRLHTSTKSKDYPWRFSNHGSLSSMTYQNGGGCDDDRSSVKSFGSFMSYTSLASQSQATEASISRPNSRVRGKKYVLHCERHIGPTEEYLTPTQRKDKEIRQLKSSLIRKSRLCEDKDAEICRLKSELERLHDELSELVKTGCMRTSQESGHLDGSNSTSSSLETSPEIDKGFFHNSTTMQNDDSGISNDLSISPRNSLEFDESDSLTRKTSVSDKESSTDPTLLESSSSDSLSNVPNLSEKGVQSVSVAEDYPSVQKRNAETQETLIATVTPLLTQEIENFLNSYQTDLDQLKVLHNEQYQELKVKFDDRVLELQQNLGDANSRYLELRPLFDKAQDKIGALENQLSEVQRDIENQEEWHNQMYLKMYRKGQESARFEQADETPEFTEIASKRLSVPDLLGQLHQLESELDQTKQLYREAVRDRQAEYTLRFLKDAVFYFLTKKDKEHLKAIQSILGFTDAERMAVTKAMKHRRLFCTVFKVKH